VKDADGISGDAEDVLLAAIVASENYHESTVALAGIWAVQRKPLADALTLIRAAFQMVPADQRDARWKERYDDVARCVQGIYHKHLHADAKAPPPRLREHTLLDPRRYALAAVRHARVRIADCSSDEREALLRVEARSLARFVANDLLTLREARDALLDAAIARGLSLDAILPIISRALEGGQG
jgi:hypothetical protein